MTGLKQGTLIGPYRLTRLLHTGSLPSHEVWSAVDEENTRVILKLCKPDSELERLDLRLMSREAIVLQRLNHPGIPQLLGDVSSTVGHRGIALTYQPGIALDLWLQGKVLTASEIRHYGVQLCDILAYIHSRRVIHGDIKPSNIIVGIAGQLGLIDFGVSSFVRDAKWSEHAPSNAADDVFEGTLVGTAPYLPPELAQGGYPACTGDIYSLGVTLYEMATGSLPFKGETNVATAYLHIHEPPPPPREWRPDLPRWLEVIILGCLAKNPSRRYQTAADIGKALSGTSTPP